MPDGHAENFPVASLLVPRRERRAIVALYRYARAADDLADEGDAPAGDRLASLGVREISGGQWCTVDSPSRFFSFRRDRITGRMAAAIAIGH